MTPITITGVWIFCKLVQPQLSSKLALSDLFKSGIKTKASRAPAQRAAKDCRASLNGPVKDLRVSSKVKTSGSTSKIKLMVLPVSLRLRSCVKFLMSALAKVISTKLAHSVKKPSAALLLSRNVKARGLKIRTARTTSGISLFYLA